MSEQPPTELGKIVWGFRDRFRLTQKDAASILGVGISTITAYEHGSDPKTKLPVHPREATLKLMAERMCDYAEGRGAPLPQGADRLYKEMMVAAGYLKQVDLDFYEGKTAEPSSEELRKGDLGIPGLTDLAASSDARWDELSDDDRRLVLTALQGAARGLIENVLQGKRQKKLKI